MIPTRPSGGQIEIVHGQQRATVVEVGGGLRSYSLSGRELLDGYGPGEMCSGGRGQVLMPWPNRIAGGTYEFEGQQMQLPLTEASQRNAIHGLVRWANWTAAEREADRVVMAYDLYPTPGYPFALELSVEYTLGSTGLHVRTMARNVGTTTCPFGAGAHPYLTVGTILIDDAVLAAPGRMHLSSNDRGIPIGKASVVGSPLDLRRPRPIGDRRLDDGFTDLVRDADGVAWVVITGPARENEVKLWLDPAYDYLMLFTGDTLPGGGRRSLAVEPMTCAPDAFRSGDGLILLEPGASFTGAWGIVAQG